MKKLKLNLDDLKVESFETTNSSKKTKGTIVGYVTETDLKPICGNTNIECPTNYNTCDCTYPPYCNTFPPECDTADCTMVTGC